MIVHKEGYRILTVLFVLLAILTLVVFGILSPAMAYKICSLGGSSLLFLFVLLFFRQPQRNIFPEDKRVYAPADGKIVVIEEIEELEYFKDKRIQVSVFMS